MNEAQIKHMVNRFLGWRLPENFSPDGGVSFKATYNEGTPYEATHQPIGTNILNAAEAEAMVRHMVEGMAPPEREETLERRTFMFEVAITVEAASEGKAKQQAEKELAGALNALPVLGRYARLLGTVNGHARLEPYPGTSPLTLD